MARDSITYDYLEDRFLPIHNIEEKGDDVQKFSVLQTLPQLLETEHKATVSRLIPKILQELPNSSCEFHIMCSKVFRVLIEQNVGINLLSAILQGIETWDPIVANAWMDTLIGVIEFLTEAHIKSEIIPMVHNKSLLTMPVSSRVACCRILGKVAVHKSLTPNDVKRDVLPLVQSLCQDCNGDVRAVICSQLPFVAQGLGSDPSKESLMVCLVELASDDVAYVKASAVNIIVQMFPYTTAETLKGTILPLVIQICSRILTTDDICVVSISRDFGLFLEGLRSSMTHNDNVWFLNFYKSMCHRGLVTGPFQFRSADVSSNVVCRQNAAANLPLVAKFVLATLQIQTDTLFTFIHDLSSDPCYLVRQTVGGCFAELLGVFGVQCKNLKADLLRILRDDSEEVLQKIVPHISVILQILSRFNLISPEIISPNSADIGRALLKCYFDLANGYNWRLLTNFLYQLESLPNSMPSDYIHQHFTPVVLTSAVHGKGKPVQTQATRTLLIFLRYNKKEMQKRWVRENMISQLCQSSSCYTRLIYIKLCQHAIDLFSEKYFKQYFLESLLTLADDPVPNVRLCVVGMFQAIKQMLILPIDRTHHDKLEAIFMKYKSEERDRDVAYLYQKQLKGMMVPVKNFDKEAHAKEQKSRQDEEEGHDNKTPSANQPTAVARRITAVPKKARNSIIQDSPLERTQNRGKELAVANDQVGNAMPFLEQNFYIDAGISLATTLSKHVGDDVEQKFPLINITDDDKVTLRNTTRNKRFSSVISTTCLESAKNPINRRSLNIEPKRVNSRIPVSSSSSGAKNSLAVAQKSSYKSSQLPVPVPKRSPKMEIRKNI